MWAALDAGSWVTPQLAAVLSISDNEFTHHAIDRLDRMCPFSDDPEYRIESPIERHSAQGPSGSRGRSAKSASSLFAVLQVDSPDNADVLRLAEDSEFRQLVASDVDNGGCIATSWRDKLVAVNNQP